MRQLAGPAITNHFINKIWVEPDLDRPTKHKNQRLFKIVCSGQAFVAGASPNNLVNIIYCSGKKCDSKRA